MGFPSKNPYNATGGGNWGWLDWKEIDALAIAEDDPEHPEHELHKWRTNPDNPKFSALVRDIEKVGLAGMSVAAPVTIYLDGGKPTVGQGRRTISALRIINAKRKPADRLPCRMVSTKDPELARDIGNANRDEDPLLSRARRYVAAYSVDNDKGAAAARNGLSLAQAGVLEKCLALPAELQRKINRCEIDPEQALRLGKDGGKEAVKKVRAATKPSGKVDTAKVREVAAPRLSTTLLRGLAKEVTDSPRCTPETKALFEFMAGNRTALDGYPEAHSLALRAGWKPYTVATASPGEAEEAAE